MTTRTDPSRSFGAEGSTTEIRPGGIRDMGEVRDSDGDSDGGDGAAPPAEPSPPGREPARPAGGRQSRQAGTGKLAGRNSVPELHTGTPCRNSVPKLRAETPCRNSGVPWD